jgi:hypothetical protein
MEMEPTSETTLETAFEDYTDMAEGSEAPGGGVIARCPRCGALRPVHRSRGKEDLRAPANQPGRDSRDLHLLMIR